MGMDVFGRKATSADGEYFRRNVWGWHPLATLCEDLAPEITSACQHWHSNDGDGLDAVKATELADRLEELVANGAIAAYVKHRDEALASLPDEACSQCDGTGRRRDTPDSAATVCKQCSGRATKRPFVTYYCLDAADVTEWISFLRSCGGFNIY